ncbi:MAG: hypothetical protein ACQERF_08830 [Actinomycetota bacterium]
MAADPDPAKTPTENAGVYQRRQRLGEAHHRRVFADAGFTDLVIRFGRGVLFARGRKPTASNYC